MADQVVQWERVGPGPELQGGGTGDRKFRVLKLTWTSATGGTVTSTASGFVIRKLYAIETDPGSPAPTASYDIAIENDRGIPIATAANRSATVSEHEEINSTNGEGVWLASVPVLKITGAGDEKQGVVYLICEA